MSPRAVGEGERAWAASPRIEHASRAPPVLVSPSVMPSCSAGSRVGIGAHLPSPTMSPIRRFLETVHLTAVGLWLGTLAMTGAAAAIIFPTVHELDPHLNAYALYTGPHWKLAAGQVASRLFLICDTVALGCTIVSGLMLGLIAASKEAWFRPWAMGIRLIAFFGALSLLTYSFFFLGPRMNANMLAYWDAAKIGDNENAALFQSAFDTDHPTASTVMVASFACVAVLMIAGVFGAAGQATQRVSAMPSPARLEEPSLAGRGRAR